MKFSDIKFTPHPMNPQDAVMARVNLPSGYTVVVMGGLPPMFKGDGVETYEVMPYVDGVGSACNHPMWPNLASDPLCWQNENEVLSLIGLVAKWPAII